MIAAAKSKYRTRAYVPLRQPPRLQPGQVLRTLKRTNGHETTAEAEARASVLGWWALRVNERPYSSARAWIWVVQL